MVVIFYSYSRGPQQLIRLSTHGSEMLGRPVQSLVLEFYHVSCQFSIVSILGYKPLYFHSAFSLPISQIDWPVNNVEEEEGEGEEGSCIKINTFSSSRYDRFGWWGFLVGFVLGLEGSCNFNWFTITVKVGKFKVSGQRSHNAEVIGAKVWLGGADFLTAIFHHLLKEREKSEKTSLSWQCCIPN